MRRIAGLSRDAFRHPPTISPGDQALSGRLIELAQTRRRFGYRRLHDLLGAGFPHVNHKRVYRLYREAKFRDECLTERPGEFGWGYLG